MKKFGLIGYKISYSMSPKIHGIIYSELGLEAQYKLIDFSPEELSERIPVLEKLDGFNVTQPHKIAITDYLTENLSPIGAVNTVKVKDGKFYGNNTDVLGFRRDAETGFGSVDGKTALIIGAGGMAEAAAFEMMDMGANVCVKNRTVKKAEELCKRVGARLFENDIKPEIIINCSSAELFGERVDLQGVDLSEVKFAYDAIYKQTEFLKTMQNCGAKCLNGLNTLIYQAIAAAEIFTDIKLSDSDTELLKEKIRREII